MPHDLERFVSAQDPVYARVLGEIARGQKTSHWMWFIFPQIAGLGSSAMAVRYAIGSLDEAQAYLTHPVLGPRLMECVTALQDLPISDPEMVFGSIDAVKLRSSLTLFAEADPAQSLFTGALQRWFRDQKDPATLERLG